MFRLAFFIAVLVVGVVLIEPAWDRSAQTLTLRVRQGEEIVALVRERALELGERAIRAAADASGPAAVGADVARPQSEKLTRADQEALDRLIREKIRESERAEAAGTD